MKTNIPLFLMIIMVLEKLFQPVPDKAEIS